MDELVNSRLSKVAERRGGHFHVRDSEAAGDPRSAADDLARSLHFRTIGESWGLVSPALAAQTLARLLHQWQVYPLTFMPAAEAQTLAKEFVESFGSDPICLTNVDWWSGELGPRPDACGPSFSWMPITEATFDAGVVCFGNGQVGMLWFEEND